VVPVAGLKPARLAMENVPALSFDVPSDNFRVAVEASAEHAGVKLSATKRSFIVEQKAGG